MAISTSADQPTAALDADALRTRFKARCVETNNVYQNWQIRVHRSLSWLKRATQFVDDQPEAKFLFLWIALNSLYSRWNAEKNAPDYDTAARDNFFEKVCGFNQALIGERLHKHRGLVKKILADPYLSEVFWRDPENPKAKGWAAADSNYIDVNFKAHDYCKVLKQMMQRLFVLRGQIVHGASTGGTAKDVSSTKSVFQSGDVLYGKLRPYLNKVCIPDFDGVCSTDILVFRESPGLNNRFLSRFLSQRMVVEHATQNSQGINLPRVNAESMFELEIDLPPKAEQVRIADKIDALKSRSLKVREALDAVGPMLEQFRQSVLAAAFRGDLTADWRAAHPNTEPASAFLARARHERRRKWEDEELTKLKAKGKRSNDEKWKLQYEELQTIDDADLPELPEGWCWTTWESCLSPDEGAFKRGPFGSSLTKAMFVSSGYKVYEQYCPINDDCSYVRYYITPEKYEEMRAFEVRAEDFLISCSGVTLGRITQVPDSHEQGIINQALLRVRVNENVIDHLFFKWLFRSPHFQQHIYDTATGSAIPNVKGVKELKAIPIPLPPLSEQRVVAKKVVEALRSVEDLNTIVSTLACELAALDQSILAKAFRGELVPQDPTDEPASELLARIRASYPPLSIPTKLRKTGTRTSIARGGA